MHEGVLNSEACPPKTSEACPPRKSPCLHSVAALLYYAHDTPSERSMLSEALHDLTVDLLLFFVDVGVL